MTKIRIVLVIVALGLLFFLPSITTVKAAEIQHAPSGAIGADGNRLVWSSFVDGNFEVFLFDQDTQTETRLTTHPANQGYPSIYGDYVVWQDDRNYTDQPVKSFDIYSYNLLTKEETKISQTTGNHEEPRIYKNYVVWRNTSGGKSEVLLYDLTTNTQKSIASSVQAFGVDIFENSVVWMQYNSPYFDIYSYDLVNGAVKRLTNGGGHHKDPHVYGNQVIWHDYRNGERDIYLYDTGSGTEKNLTPGAGNSTIKGINNGQVLFADDKTNTLLLYNTESNQEQNLGSIVSNQMIVFDGSSITMVSNNGITRSSISSLISSNIGSPTVSVGIQETIATEETVSIDGVVTVKLPEHYKGKMNIVKEEPKAMKGLIPYGSIYNVVLDTTQATNITVLFRLENELDQRLALYGFDGQSWIYLGGGMFGKERTISAEHLKYKKFILARPDENFVDITGHWAEEMIGILHAHQKINGYGEGRFEPDQSVTRAEFITLAANILELPQKDSSRNTFSDVLEDHWAYKAVANASALGVVQGDGDHFYPDNKITREEMVTILARAFRVKNDSIPMKKDGNTKQFDDYNTLEMWSKPAFGFFIQNGLIQGKEGNRLEPKANASRAEAAVFIYRVLNVLRGESQ